ncbi:MAG: hypothetical protein SF028_07140 [Candidatus Sumerlaeia bacterium]|nr:hypothetical protein [Candidatus Sumerlaeia bacterium]
MIWAHSQKYHPWAFDRETDLEAAIAQVKADLFGEQRIYLDVKKLIGERGKTRNIPDGYLLDFSSPRRPVLYLVEVELAKHDPLRHIAQQLLEFSLSFKSTPQKMKAILRETIQKSAETFAACEAYAQRNNFNNIDYLLERMIYEDGAFNTLLIIDELDEELESIVRSSLAFPVETLTLVRFRSGAEDVAYHFEPFLYDLSGQFSTTAADGGNEAAVDPAEIDTIVVPARKEGFDEVFLGENMWRAVRLHSSMVPRIRYLAMYQVAPVSAITHTAPVARIDPWKDTGKYALYFSEPATEIKHLGLVRNGRVSPPQSPRYTSMAKLKKANSLDEVF